MININFGKGLLENITTGMYKNSLVIYREYIQNACDAIDEAISLGILHAGEGRIVIDINEETRSVCIKDNGSGISALNFVKTLMDIAYSNKNAVENKGFRGMGRLCGLAYCKELIFSSTVEGENIISIIRFDAENFNAKLYSQEKITAADLLNDVTSIENLTDNEQIAAHWFKVELIDIHAENKDILDVKKVREYLSFVAPVEYPPTFLFAEKIYAHAAALNFKIDEYNIWVGNEQLAKNYKKSFKVKGHEDEIFSIEFKDFYDENKNLIAWGWIGLSKFFATISKETPMRCIRLRKGNIQIGDENTLNELFKEERGNTYFVGEIFALDKNLLPNSQRDYFNENETREQFEKALREYFIELEKIYRTASEVRNAIKAIDEFENQPPSLFPEENSMPFKVKKALQTITNTREQMKNNLDTAISKVFEKIDCDKKIAAPALNTKPSIEPKLKNFSKQKLVEKIYEIIRRNTDSATTELLISKIDEAIYES